MLLNLLNIKILARRLHQPCQAAFLSWTFAVILAFTASAQSKQQGSATIVGAVHDGAGNPVAEASVRLQASGEAGAEDRKTDTTGAFVFSELRTGTYILSASKGEKRTNEVTVSLSKGSAIQRVELTLSDSPGPASNGSQRAEMEFSDTPNFSVAAVTDWTAAGGHGSDTSLRTSEALNRETLRLKPDTKALGTKEAGTEKALKSRLEQTPNAFDANEALGGFYIAQDRFSDAIAPLERAHALDRANARVEYNLALALTRSGDLKRAREIVDRQLSKTDQPGWHRLAGEINEKSGDPLTAVREFERAAKADPSEENFFAWGSELLQHRAIWQAKDVFASGVKAYPASARMLAALGAALFAAALYPEAARRLCEVSDLRPSDSEPYLLMGQVELVAPDSLPCIESRLQRFAKGQPTNALANYYYALAYWKEHGKRTDPSTIEYVEGYLNKAVEADQNCSGAFLQLGILQASRGNYALAADFYRRAIVADPESTEAHYRLGIAYDRLGDKQKAADEFSLHDRLEKQHAAAIDRERREVKQFVVQVGENSQKEAVPR